MPSTNKTNVTDDAAEALDFFGTRKSTSSTDEIKQHVTTPTDGAVHVKKKKRKRKNEEVEVPTLSINDDTVKKKKRKRKNEEGKISNSFNK